MIRLIVRMPGQKDTPFVWHADELTIGRASSNNLPMHAENISGRHGRIVLRGQRYFYEDLGSTNGSVVIRTDGEIARLSESGSSVEIQEGDRICLASMDHSVEVEQILNPEELPPVENDSQTILAEASAHEHKIEETLGGDFDALRCAVELSREVASSQNEEDVSLLSCSMFLRAFPRATRAMFLEQDGEIVRVRDRDETVTSPPVNRCPKMLLERCLDEGKGFVFLLQDNQVQAIATMVMSVQAMTDLGESNVAIMCSPLFHNERCYGFILVEALLTSPEDKPLGRRDLSLGTLMANMIASRLSDLEDTRERLSLARKATAGFMAATVGHCFKNLLFVPMSISKMLPLCIKSQQWDEVNHMLMRNLINIRYLDMLSNEFANASKDLHEGFERCNLRVVLDEADQLINQVDPEQITGEVISPKDLPDIVCHPAAIKRLIMNLTLNAVDAIVGQKDRTEKGHIELMAETSGDKQNLILHIADNGPGMPPNIAGNLREIYQRVETSADALGELQTIAEEVRSTKEQGFKEHYGLGFLFVCQTVNQHGGSMTLEAEEGSGTVFHITLPVHTNNTCAEE